MFLRIFELILSAPADDDSFSLSIKEHIPVGDIITCGITMVGNERGESILLRVLTVNKDTKSCLCLMRSRYH